MSRLPILRGPYECPLPSPSFESLLRAILASICPSISARVGAKKRMTIVATTAQPTMTCLSNGTNILSPNR
jgi:hypothetical protein